STTQSMPRPSPGTGPALQTMFPEGVWKPRSSTTPGTAANDVTVARRALATETTRLDEILTRQTYRSASTAVARHRAGWRRPVRPAQVLADRPAGPGQRRVRALDPLPVGPAVAGLVGEVAAEGHLARVVGSGCRERRRELERDEPVLRANRVQGVGRIGWL